MKFLENTSHKGTKSTKHTEKKKNIFIFFVSSVTFVPAAYSFYLRIITFIGPTLCKFFTKTPSPVRVRLPSVCELLVILYFTLGLTLSAQTAEVRYAVMPDNPRPGEPVTIGISGGAEVKSAALTLGGKQLAKAAFFPIPIEGGKQPFMAAVLAIPSTAQPGRAVITVEGAAGIAGEIAITIAGRDFASEVIELNAALTGIRTEPDPQKTAEANHLWSILNRTGVDAGQYNAWHFDKFSR